MSEYPAEPPFGTGPGTGATGGAKVVTLTPLAQQYLDQTRPWVRFLSIVTFVSAGLMALVMLLVGMVGGLAGGGRGAAGVLGSAIGGGLMALLYLALACLYIAPGLYLARYANAIESLKTNQTASVLEDALKHQRSFWRFVGILCAVAIVVGVIGFGLAVVAGIIAALASARA
jgi:uncharacterized membrane protein YjgN (DUF898 family)